MPEIIIQDFGIKPYREIWERQHELQSELVELKRSKRPIEKEYLLIGEHNPVYTLGFHGNENNLLADEKILRQRGCECIRVERGGDITYHGPGQMIVYPIIDLESHSLGVKQYIGLLEDCVIETIAGYGLKGEKIEGATGVWLGKDTARERKICAMGVKITRGITMHGLALNVTTDLRAFSAINPCGFQDKGVCSISSEIAEINPDVRVDMDDVKRRFISLFRRIDVRDIASLPEKAGMRIRNR